MIVEERMMTYINSLDMGNTPFLEKLEWRALADRSADHSKGYAEFYEDSCR